MALTITRTVKTRCRACGSDDVRKTAVEQHAPDRWGWVIDECDGCGNRRGSYYVKRRPSWGQAGPR